MEIFCPGQKAVSPAAALSELFDYSVRWDGSGTQIVLTSYCKNHKIRSIFQQQQKNEEKKKV